MNRLKYCLFFLLLILTIIISACDSPVNDKSTSGLKLYIGDGFQFKYPGNAIVHVENENGWARRSIRISGSLIHFQSGEIDIEMPAYEIMVEFYDNPEKLSVRDFVESLVLPHFEQALADDTPTGYWPVDEQTGSLTGMEVKVHGMDGWQTSFFSGDHELIRTFMVKEGNAISIGFRSYPEANNPLHSAWRTVWLLTLESLRPEKN